MNEPGYRPALRTVVVLAGDPEDTDDQEVPIGIPVDDVELDEEEDGGDRLSVEEAASPVM